MSESTEIREKIRRVLEDELLQPQTVDRALDRIMELVDPFEKLACEELER